MDRTQSRGVPRRREDKDFFSVARCPEALHRIKEREIEETEAREKRENFEEGRRKEGRVFLRAALFIGPHGKTSSFSRVVLLNGPYGKMC